MINFSSFSNELEKISSKWEHAAEIGGLGILAAPTIADMAGHPMSKKWKDRSELAGLGVLAGPAAKHLVKGASVEKVAIQMRLPGGGVSTVQNAIKNFGGRGIGQAAEMAPGATKALGQRASGLHMATPTGVSSWANNPRAISL